MLPVLSSPLELPAEVKELISAHIERLKGVVEGGVKWV